jgi:hypothetical protein
MLPPAGNSSTPTEGQANVALHAAGESVVAFLALSLAEQ